MEIQTLNGKAFINNIHRRPHTRHEEAPKPRFVPRFGPLRERLKQHTHRVVCIYISEQTLYLNKQS